MERKRNFNMNKFKYSDKIKIIDEFLDQIGGSHFPNQQKVLGLLREIQSTLLEMKVKEFFDE